MATKKKDESKPAGQGTAPAAADGAPQTVKKPAEMTVKIGDTEYKGVCTCRRTVGKNKQVFLKLNGLVSRWFNETDVVK